MLFAVIIAVFALTNIPSQETKEIYSDLVVKIQNHEVKELSIVDDVATATLNDDSEITVEVPSYETLRTTSVLRWTIR